MADPIVSVVVPARNAALTITDTLSGLADQAWDGSFEVVVVDDGSTDDTVQVAAASAVVTRVVRLDGVGPALARNAGAAAGNAPRLAFLDADCRPSQCWLAAGIEALDSADYVLGETRPRPDREVGPFDRTLWVIGKSPLFESANMFIRRDLFERLGGFESWLGQRSGKELGEDVWLGWRAVRVGARVEACPGALAYHEVFERGPLEFASERLRLRYFPAMVKRVPELRRAAFYRRYFLNQRAARFDAAVAGLALALAGGGLVPAAAALPYARTLLADFMEARHLKVMGARVGADALGLAALLTGSLRSRTLLL